MQKMIISFCLGFLLACFFISFDESLITSPNAKSIFLSYIDKASNYVLIDTYILSSQEIEDLLIKKSKEGVKIKIILDPKISANYHTYKYLKSNGIDVLFSHNFHSNHAKFIIVDGKFVILGSHNLNDYSLEFNRETSIVSYNKFLVSSLEQLFYKDWSLANKTF